MSFGFGLSVVHSAKRLAKCAGFDPDRTVSTWPHPRDTAGKLELKSGRVLYDNAVGEPLWCFFLVEGIKLALARSVMDETLNAIDGPDDHVPADFFDVELRKYRESLPAMRGIRITA